MTGCCRSKGYDPTPSVPVFTGVLTCLAQSDQFIYNTDAGASRVLSDLPPDKGVETIRKFSPQSTRSFTDKVVHDAFRHIQASWILCEQDAVLPPDWQKGKIEFLKSVRPDKRVDVLSLDAGHCPNASDPEGAARKVLEAIAVK